MLTVERLIADAGLAMASGIESGANEVRWVHSSELPDSTPWLTGGELRQTTGGQLGVAETQRRCIRRLVEGASPGKTNVMAVRELDGEMPLKIHVGGAGRDPAALDDDDRSGEVPLRTLIDELTPDPILLEDRAARELEPRPPGGPIEFPAPSGVADTLHTLHSELQTFATSPRGIAADVVEARSTGREVRVSARTRPIEAWGLGGGIVSTPAPAAALVRLIARGRVGAVGAVPPEACVDPDDLLPELDTRGCALTVEVHERSPQS